MSAPEAAAGPDSFNGDGDFWTSDELGVFGGLFAFSVLVCIAILYFQKRRFQSSQRNILVATIDPADGVRYWKYLESMPRQRMKSAGQWIFRVPDACSLVSTTWNEEIRDTERTRVQGVNFYCDAGYKACVMTDLPIPVQNRSIFECRIIEHSGGDIALGFSFQSTVYPDFFGDVPGFYPESIGYFSMGYIHSGTISGWKNTFKPYGAGDTIGVEADRLKERFVFYKNGAQVAEQSWPSIALLHPEWFSELAMFPCVACAGHASLIVNFGSAPFRCDAENGGSYPFTASYGHSLDALTLKARTRHRELAKKLGTVASLDDTNEEQSLTPTALERQQQAGISAQERFSLFQRSLQDRVSTKRQMLERNMSGLDLQFIIDEKKERKHSPRDPNGERPAGWRALIRSKTLNLLRSKTQTTLGDALTSRTPSPVPKPDEEAPPPPPPQRQIRPLPPAEPHFTWEEYTAAVKPDKKDRPCTFQKCRCAKYVPGLGPYVGGFGACQLVCMECHHAEMYHPFHFTEPKPPDICETLCGKRTPWRKMCYSGTQYHYNVTTEELIPDDHPAYEKCISNEEKVRQELQFRAAIKKRREKEERRANRKSTTRSQRSSRSTPSSRADRALQRMRTLENKGGDSRRTSRDPCSPSDRSSPSCEARSRDSSHSLSSAKGASPARQTRSPSLEASASHPTTPQTPSRPPTGDSPASGRSRQTAASRPSQRSQAISARPSQRSVSARTTQRTEPEPELVHKVAQLRWPAETALKRVHMIRFGRRFHKKLRSTAPQ